MSRSFPIAVFLRHCVPTAVASAGPAAVFAVSGFETARSRGREMPTALPTAPRAADAQTGDAASGAARRFRRRALAVSLGCAAAGAMCFVVDLPITAWCATSPLPRELARLIDLSELFAHATGAAAVLIAALALDRAWCWSWRVPPGTEPGGRGSLPRMVAATFAGGLLVDLVKLTVPRVRPRALDLAATASAFDTFDPAAISLPQPGHADLMSFPSGHAAVSAGLATMLAWRYPHGTPVFAAWAVLAALQRLFSSAHYPSDVCLGAALGVAGAALVLGQAAPSAGVRSGSMESRRCGW